MQVSWVASALLLTAACGSPPAKGPQAARPSVDTIVLCKTTEAELLHGFGPPTRDGRLHGARVMSWIVEEDAVVHYLAVMLDPLGVVVDVYWDLPTEIPWTPTNQCLGQ